MKQENKTNKTTRTQYKQEKQHNSRNQETKKTKYFGFLHLKKPNVELLTVCPALLPNSISRFSFSKTITWLWCSGKNSPYLSVVDANLDETGVVWKSRGRPFKRRRPRPLRRWLSWVTASGFHQVGVMKRRFRGVSRLGYLENVTTRSVPKLGF